MAETVTPCFQPAFDFLNVENSDHIYFTREISKLVPHALLSFISTREFLRTREKCRMAMHSARFFISL